MKFAFSLACCLAFGAFVAPAHAQMAPSMGGVGGAPKVQPRVHTPDLAPTGLPGVGDVAPLATGPKLQKAPTGDPTVELFDAINGNNYGAAQDAISRGANLQATDQFGETPLDLSIALNRNDITFLLLGTRNELEAQGSWGGKMGAPLTLDQGDAPAKPDKASRTAPLVSVQETPKAYISVGDDRGTPDPQAGFLGFGPKS